jgi:hypothetical protein
MPMTQSYRLVSGTSFALNLHSPKETLPTTIEIVASVDSLAIQTVQEEKKNEESSQKREEMKEKDGGKLPSATKRN